MSQNLRVDLFLLLFGAGELCGGPAVCPADGCVVSDLPPSQQGQSLHQTRRGHSVGLLLGPLLFRLVSLLQLLAFPLPSVYSIYFFSFVKSMMNCSNVHLFFKNGCTTIMLHLSPTVQRLFGFVLSVIAPTR